MSLGDRMKDNYESRFKHYLTRRTPVIVRVDGKAFHTFTRGMKQPFDHDLMMAMRMAAHDVAEEMQGFKLAYIQSDEASFLITDYDRIETAAWFDYSQSKIESVTASFFTGYFHKYMGKTAFFDARAFNIPEAEIPNYFLWRAKDWERNSLSMYCRSFFSDKQMHQKNRDQQHEMLHSVGKNWATDLCDIEKNGTFICKGKHLYNIQPNYEGVNNLVIEAFRQEVETEAA